MEERKSYGMVMLFVSVFVVFLVSIMSYSLWRDKQINAFMASNRAWGVYCDMVSEAAWIVRHDERVDLEMGHLFLYCEGDHFVGRDESGRRSIAIDKFIVYQHISQHLQ